MMSRRGGRGVATAVLGAVLVAGCGTGGSARSEPAELTRPLPDRSRGDRGEVRHDLKPLTKRFGLGEPRGATWQGGVLADRAPGPSSYWIEAVVQLAPGAGAELAGRTGATPTDPPVVPEELRPALSDGPWVTSPALRSSPIMGGGFTGNAFLDVDDDVLVLLTVAGPQ
jgi:hypothetical protein